MEWGWFFIAAPRARIGTGLAVQTLRCFGALMVYILPCLLVLVPVYFFTKIPSHVFRKLLHVVAFTGVSLMIAAAGSWEAAVLTSVLIAVVFYPVLSRLERESWYAGLFVQKSPGEIKKSLLLLFMTFAAVITVAWGIFGEPRLAAAAILMWGIGDAAAALVGIPFGRHKVRSPLTDGKKSWEGSLAMLAVSFPVGLAMLRVLGADMKTALLSAAAGALVGTVTELISPSEYDTVTVPTAITAVLLMICR